MEDNWQHHTKEIKGRQGILSKRNSPVEIHELWLGTFTNGGGPYILWPSPIRRKEMGGLRYYHKVGCCEALWGKIGELPYLRKKLSWRAWGLVVAQPITALGWRFDFFLKGKKKKREKNGGAMKPSANSAAWVPASSATGEGGGARYRWSSLDPQSNFRYLPKVARKNSGPAHRFLLFFFCSRR